MTSITLCIVIGLVDDRRIQVSATENHRIFKDKCKDTYSSLQAKPAITATGNHVPCGITQCYLPPGRGDIPAFTPAEAGTRFSDPGGMQG